MASSFEWPPARNAGFDDLRAGLAGLNGQAVMIDHRAAPMLSGIINELANGKEVSEARLSTLKRPAFSTKSNELGRTRLIPTAAGKHCAVVSMRGLALYNPDWQPYAFSTLLLSRTIDQLAADPAIGTIILDCDSPGGSVTGTKEAGDSVWKARQKKRVVALISPLCASAAYWICSQATEIVSVPSGDIGSIGVYMMHLDCSKMMEDMGLKPTYIFAGDHKVDGNPYEPLKPEAREWWQRECTKIFNDFNKVVARGRGVSVVDVLANFGQGRTFMTPEALRLGLIDAIETPDRALATIVATGSVLASHTNAKLDSYRAPARAAAFQTMMKLKQLEG